MEKRKLKLPHSWAKASVKELVYLINGRAFKPEEWETTGLPIVRIQNLNNPDAPYNYSSADLPDKYLIDDGSVLFAWSGTPGTSFGAHIWRGGKAWLNQHIYKVVFNEALLNKKFLRFAINQNLYEYIGKAHGGVGLAHITKGKFEVSELIIPPLPEQYRIVAKVEELTSDLDAGVNVLKKVQGQLKRYRQSVLKSAFNGTLTKGWRERNKEELEPASVLLERIKEERKKKAKEEGKKYKGIPPIDTTDLPTLPGGWEWARIESVSLSVQYGTSDKANTNPEGIPVVRMGNIQDGRLVYDKLKYFPNDYSRLEEFLLEDGDVLFNRTNSAELVGKTAVYKRGHPCSVFASYLIRVKVNANAVVPDLLSYFINSHYGRSYIASVVSQQVGQANVNGSKLKMMPIAIPPIKEQLRIVQELEQYFSIADKVEETVVQNLKQVNQLRQSILRRAFEGNLVLQDPNDEPAEKLLERIKAERAKAEADKPKKRTFRKRKSSKNLELNL